MIAMRLHKPGDDVVITYWRNGTQHEVTVTVAGSPGR